MTEANTNGNEQTSLEARLAALEAQNQLLLAVLQQGGGIQAEKQREIVNNGWRMLYNPRHKNPDNMDWEPGTKRKDPATGMAIPRNIHVGHGMWEWGYEDPDTGKIKWSGKLSGEKPPAEYPAPIEKLREQL